MTAWDLGRLLQAPPSLPKDQHWTWSSATFLVACVCKILMHKHGQTHVHVLIRMHTPTSADLLRGGPRHCLAASPPQHTLVDIGKPIPHVPQLPHELKKPQGHPVFPTMGIVFPCGK